MKKIILFNIKNILLVVVGTLLISFATSAFILPNDLVIGGVSGIAVILFKMFGISTDL